MAYNKIPPRWLNCPRRGQPVAGTREGAAGGFESLCAGRAWGAARLVAASRGSRKAEERGREVDKRLLELKVCETRCLGETCSRRVAGCEP